MATKSMRVQLSDETQARLSTLAKLLGQSRAQVLKSAIDQRYERAIDECNALQLAEAIGRVGSIKATPKKLSTDRRHMKGFGKSR